MHLPWTLGAVGEIFAKFPDVWWITTAMPLVLGFDRFGLDLSLNLKGFKPRVKPISAAGFVSAGRLRSGAVDQPKAYGAISQESTFWRRSLWGKKLDE